jgi:hypothetical protein
MAVSGEVHGRGKPATLPETSLRTSLRDWRDGPMAVSGEVHGRGKPATLPETALRPSLRTNVQTPVAALGVPLSPHFMRLWLRRSRPAYYSLDQIGEEIYAAARA